MKNFSLRRARIGLTHLLTGLAVAAGLCSGARAQTNDGQWLGINAAYYSNLNADLTDMGIKTIRLGGDWQQSGKPDEMRYRDDAKISAFAAAGYKLCMVVPYRGYDFNSKKIDVSDFETWVSNYKDLCRQTITRYGSAGKVKVPYYICGNEPDLNDLSTGNLTAYQAYRFTRALWEAKNEINSSLTVESSPTSAPDTTFLRDMISAGVADYTDVIGVHAYQNQFDEGRLSRPWEWLKAAGKSKPVSISEAGVPPLADWTPPGITPNLFRTRWHQLAYAQAKRYGISQMLLFTNTGKTDWEDQWAYRDRHNNNAPIQGAYDEVKYGLGKRTNLNGGFESDNDRWHEWTVLQPINTADVPSWANFTAGGAHSGARCLKIAVGQDWRQVRKVLEGLTVGANYTLSAWVKLDGAGQAYVNAMGFNRTLGNQEASASVTGSPGTWQKVSVSFTPTNPWVVISLASPGATYTNAFISFDDISLSGGPTPAPTTFSGTYKLIARHSGKVLDVSGGPSYTQDGVNVQQWEDLNQTSQQWVITATDGGYYTLKAKHSGRMLSVNLNPANNGSNDGSATGNGANVFQYGTDSANNRQWKIESVGDGYYKLTNRQTGRVLDVDGGVTATQNGANVHQWTYKSQTNQQWMLTQISTSTSASAPAAATSTTATSPSGGAS